MTAIPNALDGFADDAAAPAPAADPTPAVDRLNALLRGEIASVETYAQVIEKAPPAHAGPLDDIRAEHARSGQLLQARITDLGGTPSDGSGLWGVWAHAVQSALTLFAGEPGGLRALREGEEHGQRDYESALNGVDAVSAQLIQDRLLPAQQRHLATLDRLLSDAAAGT